jgi:hypothetical protein
MPASAAVPRLFEKDEDSCRFDFSDRLEEPARFFLRLN